jgi:hypothetical protein
VAAGSYELLFTPTTGSARRLGIPGCTADAAPARTRRARTRYYSHQHRLELEPLLYQATCTVHLSPPPMPTWPENMPLCAGMGWGSDAPKPYDHARMLGRSSHMAIHVPARPPTAQRLVGDPAPIRALPCTLTSSLKLNLM